MKRKKLTRQVKREIVKRIKKKGLLPEEKIEDGRIYLPHGESFKIPPEHII